MKFKKILSTVLCTTLLVSSSLTTAYAYDTTSQNKPIQKNIIKNGYDIPQLDISPYFNYTQTVALYFSFNGSNAETAISIDGSSSVTKITGTLSIKKKNSNGSYTTLKSWKLSENSSSLYYENTSYSVSSRGEYQASFVGKVYAGSKYDSINITDNETY